MEAELAAELKRLGLAQAYFQFTVAINHEPLNPHGWLGLALVAEASGDTRQGAAYRQRAARLAGMTPPGHVNLPQNAIQDDDEEIEPLVFSKFPLNARPDGFVQSAPSVPQVRGFVPVIVEPDTNLRPWIRIGCLVLAACGCVCLLGILNPNCRGSPYSAAVINSSTPSVVVPSKPEVPARNSAEFWDTVKLSQLGNVFIMIPPGIEKSYGYEHHADHDHFEFKAPGGGQPYIKIDISTPGHNFDPWANATGLDRSFAKVYGANYHKTRLNQKDHYVVWQFDVTKHGQVWRKSDFFTTMNNGRTAAILVEADPSTFERYRSYLRSIYLTLTSGNQPDEPDMGTL